MVDPGRRAAGGDFLAKRVPIFRRVSRDDPRRLRRNDGILAGRAILQRAVEKDQARKIAAIRRQFKSGSLESDRPGRIFGDETGAFQTGIFLYLIVPAEPMKLFTAIFAIASVASLHALVAQDAASSVPVPAPLGSGTSPSANQSTPSLFPSENPPPVQTQPPRSHTAEEDRGAEMQNPFTRKNQTAQSSEDVANNIAYRKAKTKALEDAKVQQALADARATKNDLDKRAALKRYYTLLAAQILKIDGSIKKVVATRLKDSLKQLDQSKVRPEEYSQQASATHYTRRVRLVVRTQPSQGWCTGSTPVRAANVENGWLDAKALD